MNATSPFLQRLRNRIDLSAVPFTERGSRILLFCNGARFHIKLAERWAAWEPEYGHYRRRLPLVRDLRPTIGDRPVEGPRQRGGHVLAADDPGVLG